ncbi:MAG: glycosyltransferase [Blastocatellia bacterium]|nr:glycosyltransferase [Blastocatellia bacterium]
MREEEGAVELPFDEGLRHGIDLLQFTSTNRTILIMGWAFNSRAPIVRVRLVIETGGERRRVDCKYGFQRADVGEYFQEASARNAGFSARIDVDSAAVAILFLEADYVDGTRARARIEKAPALSMTSPTGIERLLAAVPASENGEALLARARAAGLDAEAIRFLEELGARETAYVVMFDHNVGGGANFYSTRRIERLVAEGRSVLRVYYDLSESAFRVEKIDGAGRGGILMSRLDPLLQLAGRISVESVFVNNLYTHEDPLHAIDAILGLKAQTGARLTVAFHDYYGICPEFNLLDVHRKYCGAPDPQSCRNCLRDNRSEVLRTVVSDDIDAWRVSWGRLFREADEVLGFSEASLRIFRKIYPEIDDARILLRPHAVDYLPERRPRITQTERLHIGIIGTIHENKGAALVVALAEHIARCGLPVRITVIGELIVPEKALDRLRPVLNWTGRYEPAKLPEMIEAHGINVCFLPSMWPETFSYVTSEIMALGAPLAVYPVGAPPERVASYEKGRIIEGMGDAPRTLRELMAFHQALYAPSLEAGRQPAAGEGRVYAYTSANVHYLPKARLLCRSIKEHHPEFRFVLVLVDGRPDWFDARAEPFDEIVSAEELAIENLDAWIFQHDVVELCTAVKPFAAGRLLARSDCAKVLYFDPDMVLFSRLDDLLAELSAANLCLTPHQTVPEETLEHVIDNEICSLKHGVYNLGFIGVNNTPEGRRFTQWWSDRLYRFCRADIPNGLFTDQKWIDLAPSFFEGTAILKSPRFNVATWNLTTRKLTGGPATGYLVDGAPLGFYHFTGFDSGAHAVMAKKNVPGNLALMNLLLWYKEQLAEAKTGQEAAWKWPYGFYLNGEAITSAHRALYRTRMDLQAAFPAPRETHGETNYYRWLRHEGLLESGDAGASVARARPVSPSAHTAAASPGDAPAFHDVYYDFKRWLWHQVFSSTLRRGVNLLRGRS